MTRGAALALMVAAPTLWSSAGVVKSTGLTVMPNLVRPRVNKA